MTVFVVAAIVITGLVCTYLLVIRPWHLKWGATHEEQVLAMPGDDIVPDPDFNATRGIYIQLTGRIQDW